MGRRRYTIYRDQSAGLTVDLLPDGSHIEVFIVSKVGTIVHTRLGYNSAMRMAVMILFSLFRRPPRVETKL